jgi:hypothetical protein
MRTYGGGLGSDSLGSLAATSGECQRRRRSGPCDSSHPRNFRSLITEWIIHPRDWFSRPAVRCNPTATCTVFSLFIRLVSLLAGSGEETTPQQERFDTLLSPTGRKRAWWRGGGALARRSLCCPILLSWKMCACFFLHGGSREKNSKPPR